MDKVKKASITYLKNRGYKILDEDCGCSFDIIAKDTDGEFRFINTSITEPDKYQEVKELLPKRRQIEQDMMIWLSKNDTGFGGVHFDMLNVLKVTENKALIRYWLNAKDSVEYEKEEV